MCGDGDGDSSDGLLLFFAVDPCVRLKSFKSLSKSLSLIRWIQGEIDYREASIPPYSEIPSPRKFEDEATVLAALPKPVYSTHGILVSPLLLLLHTSLSRILKESLANQIPLV